MGTMSWLIVQRIGFVSRNWLEGVLLYFQYAIVDSSFCHGIAGILPAPLHALQVYGDAVMDEAPLLILTNYHVTVFLKRSEDVQDKRLWASEPIWFDQADPPARVSWVHGLQQAQELRHLKHRLPRAVVPPTVQGYHIQLRPREARRQPQPALLSGPRKRQCTANQQADAPSSSAHHARQRSAGKPADVLSSSGSQTRLRPAQQLADKASSSAGSLLQRATQSPHLQAPSATGKGYEANSHPPAAQPVAAGLANPAAENTLLLSELGLTGELLEEGLYGHTLKVSVNASHPIGLVVVAHVLGVSPCVLACRHPASALAQLPATALTFWSNTPSTCISMHAAAAAKHNKKRYSGQT